MIDIRPFSGLGHANHGWLDAVHHFSFAGYHDPERMGWGRIRVNGIEAQPRDGIAVSGEGEIVVEALDDAAVVMVDAL